MPSLQTFTFEVRDGSGDTHEVTVVRYAPGRLTTHCTCAAGVDGRCCEHCLRLLAGDTTQLVSDNEVEVAVLEWWVACLDLKQTVTRVRQAQERGTLPPASISKVFAHWPELTAGDEEAQLEGTGHAMVRHPGVGALELGAA